MGERDSHGVVWCLIEGYEVFVIDVSSCSRPWLVRESSIEYP